MIFAIFVCTILLVANLLIMVRAIHDKRAGQAAFNGAVAGWLVGCIVHFATLIH